MKISKFISFLLSVLIIVSCNSEQPISVDAATKGKLFIIGGGPKPAWLIQEMLKVADLGQDDYAVVLPMASSEPDTAAYYAIKMFSEVSFENVYAIIYDSIKGFSNSDINRLKGAKLVYITGGDQNKFMKLIENSNIKEIIHEGYKNGATIAGTSAGAAIMGKKMLTGEQKKHPVYTGNFSTIESSNIEIAEGLDLLTSAIIDQHFIKRQRLNRLIAVCLENPAELAIGIDESTAMVIQENKAKVIGESQIIVLNHKLAETKIVNGLLGGKDVSLSVYLPGDIFYLNE